MKSQLAAFIAVIVCFPAFAEDAPKPASSPEPSGVVVKAQPGDSWEYEVRDELTDQLKSTERVTVTEMSPTELDARVRWTIAKTQTESSTLSTFDRNWRTKEEPAWRSAPYIDWTGIPDGLALNKTWTYTRKSNRLSPPLELKYAGQAKVAAWEQITLPDGSSHDAYRIEYTEAVTPVVNNRKIEIKVVEWYAPDVNRFVKRTWESRQNGKLVDGSVESLTAYEPKS